MAAPNVLTVTVNPALDVAVTVEYLVPDHKLRAIDHRREPGGGGINVSRVLHRLGVDSKAWIAAGGPTGDEVTAMVEAEGILPVVHRIEGTTRESIAITDDKRNEQYRIVLPGPTVEDHEEIHQRIVELAHEADVVVFSGSLPPGLPAGLYAAICEAVDDAVTVVDTKGEALAAVVAGSADVVKPSRRELASLVDWVPADEDEIVLAARRVLDRGRVGALAVSLGKDGAMLVERSGEVTFYEPVEVAVQSTVGAGDSMVGGLVAGLAAGRPLVEAVRLGVAAGTATVLTPGTQLCRREDVERILPEVRTR
jgi:6-phosphofructokinase 2